MAVVPNAMNRNACLTGNGFMVPVLSFHLLH